MSRCATAWQRRPRRQRPRSAGPEESENSESEKNYFKIWFRKEQNAQTEVDGAGTRADPEGLADNDIHRLVRVTAL